jgi:hypothetical protein
VLSARLIVQPLLASGFTMAAPPLSGGHVVDTAGCGEFTGR